MSPTHSQLRVLLIQARKSIEIVEQEQVCFLERCKLEPGQMDSLNLGRISELPSVDLVLNGYDALFIGGAGEYSAANDYSWMPFALDVVKEAYDRNLPTFGSCWGHQLIARALGGTVEHDHDRAELGCHEVQLTKDGQSDALFKEFPASFLVNMGHHDRVTCLPKSGIELANNTSQPNEAFRIRDRPIYGTQFHSELDARREKERLIHYRSYYLAQLPSEEIFQAVLDGLMETTEVDHLMFDFLRTYAVSSSS